MVMFPRRFPQPTDTRELHDLCQAGNRQARAVLAEAARRTGQLCSLLVDIFSPEVILLGSLSRYFGAGWVRLVRSECIRESLPANVSATRILPAKLGARLQDLSAIAPCVYAAEGRS